MSQSPMTQVPAVMPFRTLDKQNQILDRRPCKELMVIEMNDPTIVFEVIYPFTAVSLKIALYSSLHGIMY